MIIKSKEKTNIVDNSGYIGIWNDDHVCVPFPEEDIVFEVDGTAHHHDTRVYVSIYHGWATCTEEN